MFYTVRLALGLVSASTEATLVEAANQKFGARVGMYTLMLLCVSSGCFNASTSMYVHCLVYGVVFSISIINKMEHRHL